MPASLNGNRVILPATSYSNSWSTSVDGSGVKIGKTFNIPAPGGRSAAAAVSSKLTGRAVLSIGAKALGAAVPVIGAGALLYDIYDASRVYADGTGGLVQDQGQPPEEQQKWTCSGPGMPQQMGGSVSEACTGYASKFRARFSDPYYGVVSTISTGCSQSMETSGSCTVRLQTSQGEQQGTYAASVQLVPTCPAVTDPFNPAHSTPGGAPVGRDGKCPAGRGSGQPIDAEQAAQHAAQVERSADVYKQIMDDILDRQPVPIPKGVETKIETVTPSKVQGPTTTTTGPGGVTETATGWDFGRISQDLAEDFNAGRWAETTTATTTKPDGTKETTTTTEEGTTPEEEAAKDGDLCKADPGRLGCIGLGEAPNVEVPKSTKSVSFASESIGGGGGCPAPRAIGNLGQFEFTQLCNGLVTVKPLIVLLGLFLSGMIVVNALRA